MPPRRQQPPRRRARLTSMLALLLAAAAAATGAAAGASPPPARMVVRLDDGAWRFSRTDTVVESLAGDCADGSPCQPGFDDSAWRRLTIPHDFVVEVPLVYTDDSAAKTQGYRDYGKAWYRLAFSVPEEWSRQQRTMWLDFDGIAGNATTYFNGKRLGRHYSGYTSFRYAIDQELVRYNDGVGNVLAIHVDASTPDGWWYDGGGLSRSIRLVATNPLHIIPWGIYLPSAVKEGSIRPAQAPPSAAADKEAETEAETEARRHDLVGDATLRAQVTVTNDAPTAATFVLRVVVTGPGLAVGPEVTARSPAPLTLGPGAAGTFMVPLELRGVALWSVHHPHLYQVAVQVWDAGVAVLLDEVKETTGVRTLRFDAEEGFFLNGVPTKIQGMCNHQDFAGAGVAVPPSLQVYRVRRMKEMGANAWRTAHNPPAPELLEETDRQGLMVWDENHRNMDAGPPQQWLEDLQSLVLRDRNRPSVIMWSICNEALCQGFNATAARTLAAEIKRLDPEGNRPVSAAQNAEYEAKPDFGAALDVFGVNYNIVQYDLWHSKHPQQPMIASETSSALSDRGVYAKDETRCYLSSYDENCPPWGATAEDGWCPIATRPHMSGAFIWTGFDYRGEPTPYAWPSVSSHFGVIDIGGMAKDLFYYYQSVWTSKPVVRLVPHHWDWDPTNTTACAPHCRTRWLRRGLEIDVHVFTNGDEVELLLNGESLGKQPVPVEPGGAATTVRCRRVEFKVAYAPGTLEARAYRQGSGGSGSGSGSVWATDRITTTTGVPAALGLAVDWPLQAVLEADGSDVALVDVRVLDADGRAIETTASHRNVSFTLRFDGGADAAGGGSGGRIVGVGNGDPSCHEPEAFPETLLAAWRSTFMGHARVVVQAGRSEGALTLTATSPGLAPASVTVAVRNDKLRDIRARVLLQSQYQETEVAAAPDNV